MRHSKSLSGGADYNVYQVFTPTTQARLNYVSRDSLNDPLVDALRTPGQQLVVYGESGSGKSTLLQRKLEELYPDHITTRCNASTTYEAIILDAFDQLDRYYDDQTTVKHGRGATLSLGPQFAAVKAQLGLSTNSERTTSGKRLLPPQLTAQRLGQFVGENGLCWVLEDIHKVPSSEKTLLAQTFKVFSDLAGDYPDLRIIAIGATETAREVIQYDPEMRNRVSEVRVPLLTSGELYSIMANGSELMNIDMSMIAPDIISFSSGLASVTHHLSLNACLAAGVENPLSERSPLDANHLESAVKRYIDQSSDTLKALLDVALRRHRERKFDNTRLILVALASGPVEGLSHAAIRAKIQETVANYPPGNVTKYLRTLTLSERGQIVVQSASGNYRFRDPIVHSYARAVLDVKVSSAWSDHLATIIISEINKVAISLDVGAIETARPPADDAGGVG